MRRIDFRKFKNSYFVVDQTLQEPQLDSKSLMGFHSGDNIEDESSAC